MPGTRLAPLPHDDRVPLMLIQNSTNSRSISPATLYNATEPTVHGWTLIVPMGWGMPFLSSLIFTGSRVGGLREVKTQSIESGISFFPDDFPGTLIGNEHIKRVGQERREKWERTPPAKRPSYEALGILSPFEPNWKICCGILMSTAPDGFVDTQRRDEEEVEIWLLRGPDTNSIIKDLLTTNDAEQSLLTLINTQRGDRGLLACPLDAKKLFTGALVQVKITSIGRGVASDMSEIHASPFDDIVKPEVEPVSFSIGLQNLT